MSPDSFEQSEDTACLPQAASQFFFSAAVFRDQAPKVHHAVLLRYPCSVWAAHHLPQNRDVFMTCGGNGSLELWKYSYPTQRKIKEKDGHEKGVLGQVQLLQKKTFSTQPVASFDWNADKEGLAVMGLLDQTVRVLVATKLNLL